MKLISTWFDGAGRPRGRIVRDDQTGQVDFIPCDDDSPLEHRHWNSVNELMDCLQKMYGRPQS